MSVNDHQVGGSHYKNVTGKQHWDIMADAVGPGYIMGCATKYLFRWRDKNGIQDLLKAQHYLEKLIDLYKNVHYFGMWISYMNPTKFEDIPKSVGSDELKICLMILNHPWPGLCGGMFDYSDTSMHVLKEAHGRLVAFITLEQMRLGKEHEGLLVKDAYGQAKKKVVSHPDYAPSKTLAFEDQPKASELHPG